MQDKCIARAFVGHALVGSGHLDMNAKQTAGLTLLSELKGDFTEVHETLAKIVGNIVRAPTEPKFRSLKTSNARIAKLLQAPGAQQLLVGSGFVEESESLVLPEAADAAVVEAALAGLTAQQEARTKREAQEKLDAVQQQRASALAKRKAAEPPASVPQAKASHILLKVSDAEPQDAIEAKLAKWKAVLDDTPHHLMQNKFAELAKAHSKCPSGAKGGALGFFAKGKMVDEFDAVCFSEKIGGVYGPVRVKDGAHLIWLQARIAGKGPA